MVSQGNDNWQERLAAVDRTEPLCIKGKISSMTGLTVEVNELAAPMGAQCEILARNGQKIFAEVIGFRNDVAVLMPLGDMAGIACGDIVVCASAQIAIPIGKQLLGRVVDGYGEPIDNMGALLCQTRRPIRADRVEPLHRVRIDSAIGTGIRALDAFCTCGSGQRLGIFSGPGVGKSVLLGMIARYTSADVAVIALVGERGREVREFIEKDLGPEGLSHSVVVVSTSDEPAPLRVRASFVATTIAEYFRDQGKNVLLLMDSVTRVAMAQRQIGLALGEPPATKGYTPSVFALLPQLTERCGRNQAGSITGFYTVLVEGDDLSEPVSDAMRGILDGHVWLSRELANKGHYPAIDILESISRVMPDVTDLEHQQASRDIKRLIAVYKDIEDLVNLGAYTPGNNVENDLAVQARDVIGQFLRQEIAEHITLEQAIKMAKELAAAIRQISGEIGGISSQGQVTNTQQQGQINKPLSIDRMAAGL